MTSSKTTATSRSDPHVRKWNIENARARREKRFWPPSPLLARLAAQAQRFHDEVPELEPERSVDQAPINPAVARLAAAVERLKETETICPISPTDAP